MVLLRGVRQFATQMARTKQTARRPQKQQEEEGRRVAYRKLNAGALIAAVHEYRIFLTMAQDDKAKESDFKLHVRLRDPKQSTIGHVGWARTCFDRRCALELLRAPIVRMMPEEVRELVIKMIFVHQRDALEGPPVWYKFPGPDGPFAPWFVPFMC